MWPVSSRGVTRRVPEDVGRRRRHGAPAVVRLVDGMCPRPRSRERPVATVAAVTVLFAAVATTAAAVAIPVAVVVVVPAARGHRSCVVRPTFRARPERHRIDVRRRGQDHRSRIHGHRCRHAEPGRPGGDRSDGHRRRGDGRGAPRGPRAPRDSRGRRPGAGPRARGDDRVPGCHPRRQDRPVRGLVRGGRRDQVSARPTTTRAGWGMGPCVGRKSDAGVSQLVGIVCVFTGGWL